MTRTVLEDRNENNFWCAAAAERFLGVCEVLIGERPINTTRGSVKKQGKGLFATWCVCARARA